jgi:hypothetical protein
MSELGQKLIESARRLAAERPSFVYKPERTSPNVLALCKYVHDDGRPGCIIGHALFEAGLIDASMRSTGSNTGSFLELSYNLDLDLDEDETWWLGEVQRSQDSQCPWGLAVRIADKEESL